MGSKQKQNKPKKQNQSKLHSLTYFFYDVHRELTASLRPIVIPFMNKGIHNRFIEVVVHSTERCSCTYYINNYGQRNQSYQL